MGKDYNIQDFAYNGKYSKYFWDASINANASIVNGLANCTTFAYGLAKMWGLGAPVKRISDAKNWHKNVSDDWEVLDYAKENVRHGDILEWESNHVAVAEDNNYVHASWYTGEHGAAYYDGVYDTRNNIHSLQELSNFMIENYPYRFYHYVTISQENKSVGGVEPRYILRKKNSDTDIEKIKKSIDEINAALISIKEAL